ncbi:MAG: hypothetical protein HUU55_17010 [Myxococcales bacterium]|nr:hypothetical protein [Myxococcales bacterium]
MVAQQIVGSTSGKLVFCGCNIAWRIILLPVLGLNAAAGLVGCAGEEPGELSCRSDGTLGACCDAANPCVNGAFCSGDGDLGKCVAECNPAQQDCPQGFVCVTAGGKNQCVADTGYVGAVCSSSDGCRPGLSCVSIGTDGVCTAECAVDDPCPPAETVGERVCIRLSGDVGNYCLAPCETTDDCFPRLTCTPVGDFGLSVCFPNFE